MKPMPGELSDNRGRGEAEWNWPAIHPEGRKFGLIAVVVALAVLLGLDWEIVGWPLLLLSMLGLADTAFDLRGRAAKKNNSGRNSSNHPQI